MKKLLAWIMVAILALALPTAVAEVSKGAKGDEVKEIQQILADLGYLTGKVDGDFGGGTEKAVKAFQAAEGLEETGVVDDGTMEKLNERKKEWDAEEEVRQAEARDSAVPELFQKYADRMLNNPELNARTWDTGMGLRIIAMNVPHHDGALGTAIVIFPPAGWTRELEVGGIDKMVLFSIPSLKSISWSEERRLYQFDSEFEDILEQVPDSETTFSYVIYDWQVYDWGALEFLWIDLPNDPTMEGKQTVTVSDPEMNTPVTLEFNFHFLGKGKGWDVEYLNCRDALPEELPAEEKE